jgi:hypothetical protein
VIGFYVIMIAVLAMSAAVGYTIFTSVQTTNALSLAERNAARLEMTASALRQVVIANAEGGLFVPMGVPSIAGVPTSRTALPDWISGEAITPWGIRYAYCPYAPVTASGGPGATVYGGSSYTVTTNPPDLDPVVYGAARDYVVSGARPANGLDAANAPEVLAFLISPSNNAALAPSCDGVYWDGRAWLTSGPVTGSVRALTLDALADSLSQAPRQLRRHVEQGATGSGLTASDPAGLLQVLTEWRYLRPHRLTVSMQDDGGEIVIEPALIDLGAGPAASAPGPDGFGRHLVLEASPGDSPVLNGSPDGWLRAPSDLTINGVTFGDNLGLAAIPGSRVLVRNATLPALETGGGDIVLGAGVNIIAPFDATIPPVRVNGGSLSVEGSVTIDATEAGGSAVRHRGGRIHIDATLTAMAGGNPLFEADSYGDVSATATASLDLNGGGVTLLDPYTRPVAVNISCTPDSLTCAVTCPDARVALSGSCNPGAVTNIFLQGTTISGSLFTCDWAKISQVEISLPQIDEVPESAGPAEPVASAFCAPKR